MSPENGYGGEQLQRMGMVESLEQLQRMGMVESVSPEPVEVSPRARLSRSPLQRSRGYRSMPDLAVLKSGEKGVRKVQKRQRRRNSEDRRTSDQSVDAGEGRLAVGGLLQPTPVRARHDDFRDRAQSRVGIVGMVGWVVTFSITKTSDDRPTILYR